MDTTILISILISIGAVIIAALSLYINSLKNIDLRFTFESRAEDISEDEWRGHVPTSLHFYLDMYIWNSGNVLGVIRGTKIDLSPSNDFNRFISDKTSFECKEKIDVPAGEGVCKTFEVNVTLANISNDIKESIDEIEENGTLLFVLNDLKEKKIKNIKELLNFLKKNKKLGKMEITMEYTTSWHNIGSIEFKEKTETSPINYSHENLLKAYDYWMHNFEFRPSKDKMINGTIGNLKSLKGFYTRSLNEYRSHKNWLIDAGLELQNGRFQNSFKLLRKCRKYKDSVKIIEKPYERVREFSDYIEKYKGIYPKDMKQKAKDVDEMLKDFEKETQEAIENINSLIESIKAEKVVDND